MGRKPSHNYSDQFFLLEIEGIARDGACDKEIAKYLGVTNTYFCELKIKFPELVESLTRARRPLNTIVENAFYKRATGMKVKTTITRYILDKEGNKTGMKEVQETETEIPPDTFAIKHWLMSKKPKVWNVQPQKIDLTTDGNPFLTLMQEASKTENGEDTGNTKGKTD